jgi:hypothetical protein
VSEQQALAEPHAIVGRARRTLSGHVGDLERAVAQWRDLGLVDIQLLDVRACLRRQCVTKQLVEKLQFLDQPRVELSAIDRERAQACALALQAAQQALRVGGGGEREIVT